MQKGPTYTYQDTPTFCELRYFANPIAVAILANSDGWIFMNPISNQEVEPATSLPKNNTAKRKKTDTPQIT